LETLPDAEAEQPPQALRPLQSASTLG